MKKKTTEDLILEGVLGKSLAKNKAQSLVNMIQRLAFPMQFGLSDEKAKSFQKLFIGTRMRTEFKKAITTGNPVYFEDLLKAVNLHITKHSKGLNFVVRTNGADIVKWLTEIYLESKEGDGMEIIGFTPGRLFEEIKAAYIAHFKIESFTKAEDKKLRKAIDSIGYKFKHAKPGPKSKDDY